MVPRSHTFLAQAFFDNFSHRSHTPDVFELPVLGKYFFRREDNLQPFVSTGYSFRKALAESQASVITENNTTKPKSSYWTPLDIGATFASGLRWRFGRISLTPEFRYTLWGSPQNRYVSRHQADFPFGITF